MVAGGLMEGDTLGVDGVDEDDRDTKSICYVAIQFP